jgi:hypothetical protein
MRRNAKERAIDAVIEATSQTRDEVLAANPKLAPVEAVAQRPGRAADSTAKPAVPAGVPDPWA